MMENFRQVFRGGVSAVILALAITGLGVEMVLGRANAETGASQGTMVVVIGGMALVLFEGIIGGFLIRYLKKQEQRRSELAVALGLGADHAIRGTLCVVYMCIPGLAVILGGWIAYLAGVWG